MACCRVPCAVYRVLPLGYGMPVMRLGAKGMPVALRALATAASCCFKLHPSGGIRVAYGTASHCCLLWL